MGLWSFLRSLWPWRKRRRPGAVASAATPAEPALQAPDEVIAAAPPAHELAPEPVGEPAEAPPAAIADEEALGEELTSQAAPDVYVWTEPEGADEDEGWEDEDDDLDGPDPFISGVSARDEPVDLDLEARRAAARAEALEADQRIYLHTPVGPGSLAEALDQLMAEGLVQAEFVDDTDGEPHILYRPVG
jgi:hypothetical protein